MDEAALSFITSHKNERVKEFPDVSSGDSDLISWLLMNSDLVPNPLVHSPYRQPEKPEPRNQTTSDEIRLDDDLLLDTHLPPSQSIAATTTSASPPSSSSSSTHIINTSSSAAGISSSIKTDSAFRATNVPLPPSSLNPKRKTIENNQKKALTPKNSTSTSSSSSSSSTAINSKSSIGAANTTMRKRVSNAAAALAAAEAAEAAAEEVAFAESTEGMTEEEKRIRRLEKNREIAKNCRKRKREKVGALEEELARLKEWNRQLEKKLNQGEDGTDQEDIRQREMNEIIKMVQGKASETEMKKKLEAYKEVYSDFGKQRRVAITFHLEQLKALLLPNQVSKMTLWSLQQDDEFYDEKKNQNIHGGGIWNLLCSELQLTDDQKKALVEMRHPIRMQRENVGECLKILGELEQRISENFDSMSAQMSGLMQTISPLQQAKFLIWIENNQPFMHMLNYLYHQANQKSTTASNENSSESITENDHQNMDDDSSDE